MVLLIFLGLMIGFGIPTSSDCTQGSSDCAPDDKSGYLAPAAVCPPQNAADCARLSIPAAEIDIAMTQFPYGQGTWDISPWEPLVGHFEYTDWFSGRNTVLGAHSVLANHVTPGAFYDLYDVELGDTITVNLGNLEYRYVVTEIYIVPYTDVSPIHQIHRHRLTLITCDLPSRNPYTDLYDDRLVVVAERVVFGKYGNPDSIQILNRVRIPEHT